MKELEASLQDSLQCPEGRHVALCVLSLIESGLDHLNVPVAELVPDELVDFLNGNTQFEAVHVIRDIPDDIIESGEDPLVLGQQACRHFRRNLPVLGHIHHDETAGVPDLVGKIAAGLDTAVGEALRLASTRLLEKRMSLPGALPVTRVRRRASAP